MKVSSLKPFEILVRVAMTPALLRGFTTSPLSLIYQASSGWVRIQYIICLLSKHPGWRA